MALKVLFTGFGEKTVEQHAQESVRRYIQYHTDPHAPLIPAVGSALVQHSCDGWDEEEGFVRGHTYWGPTAIGDYLCPEHRQMQMEYEKRKRNEARLAQIEAAEATGRALGEAIVDHRFVEVT